MSGIDDSVENYQSYLVACCADLVFESYEIPFFLFWCISISLKILMLTYALTHIFLLGILLLAVENA